jgi:hypothetical protein
LGEPSVGGIQFLPWCSDVLFYILSIETHSKMAVRLGHHSDSKEHSFTSVYRGLRTFANPELEVKYGKELLEKEMSGGSRSMVSNLLGQAQNAAFISALLAVNQQVISAVVMPLPFFSIKEKQDLVGRLTFLSLFFLPVAKPSSTGIKLSEAFGRSLNGEMPWEINSIFKETDGDLTVREVLGETYNLPTDIAYMKVSAAKNRIYGEMLAPRMPARSSGSVSARQTFAGG